MTKTRHKRTVVASMFQNDISQNNKCAERDGFRRDGHILDCVRKLLVTCLPLDSTSDSHERDVQ